MPRQDHAAVLLAHGGGGMLMRRLIALIREAFGDETVQAELDAALLEVPARKIAFTTDSYVVHPLFFPGGDIGRLAVNGTVNDLATSGAKPLYLSVGFILEEGLPMEHLWQIACSIRGAADEAGVQIVTGDTKVVDRGKGDGVFINTTGIGVIEHALNIAPVSTQGGDHVLINGDLARHGMAIMAVREGLAFESDIESDTAPLSDLVQDMLNDSIEIRCMRDPTRGGVASALIEIAETAGLSIEIDEAALPVRRDVSAACEILGLDPLYVANEGRMLFIIPDEAKEKALQCCRSHPKGTGAAIIGRVMARGDVPLTMISRIGTRRIVDMMAAEQLPRIC